MFIWILFLHWIGDFVLQSGKMAAKKHKDFEVLLDHILMYMLVIGFGSLFVFDHSIKLWGWPVCSAVFMIINSFAHLVLDFVSSKVTAYLYSKHRIHDFFTVIGFDQFLHITILYLTYIWLL